MIQKILNNKKLFYGSIGLLIVIIVGAFFFFGGGNGIEVVSAEKRDLTEVVEVSGTVLAESVAELGFQVSGTVAYVSAKTNQPVYAGQELLRLNLGTLPAELKSAQADLAITRAENSNTAINLDSIKQKQDSLVASAYSKMLSDSLEVEPSSHAYTQTPPVISGRYQGPEGTYKVIVRRGIQSNDSKMSIFNLEQITDSEISKTTATPLGTRGLFITFPDDISDYYDTIWYVNIPNTKSSSYTANYNAYQEAVRERDRAIDEATQNLREESVGSSIAQAEITRAQSAVERIQAEINKHIIRAPFAGIVASLDIDPGEAINAGSAVVTVISDSKLGVEIDLPEIDSIKVNIGDRAEIILDALGEEKFIGTVESVNRTESIVDGVAVYESRIVFETPDPRIISGMTATVSITTDQRENVTAVPLRAIQQKSDGSFFVTTTNSKGDEAEKTVRVGLRSSDGYAEIISGLLENEKVVVKNSLRVGFLLGIRQIQYASIWTTGLIIFVMMLTFLNLVVVSGILVGLIEGSVKAYSEQFTGEIYVATPEGEEFIEESSRVLLTLDTIPGIADYTARYTDSGTLEANYRVRRDPTELADRVSGRIAGIDPLAEDRVTNLSRFVVEGEYLDPDDSSYIMIGANMLDQYAPDFGEGFDTLDNVHPGTRVKLTAGDRTKEYIVKGVIDSKVDETSRRIFMTDGEFIRFVGRTNLNVNEIAIRPDESADPSLVKANMLASGLGKTATIRLSREALPQALEDIILTFELLGNAISSVGLVVSSITVFIVVFVNAITRRKFIGILKGIGISAWAIEFSYVFQSLAYALSGAAIAMVIIYGFLVPFFDSHPIDFPFSDGILVAPLSGTLVRLLIMIIATLIAGFVPAWLIIKKNTLDSILGR